MRYGKPIVAALSAALVISLFVRGLDRTSPGPLSATHAAVDGLSDASSCSRCHSETSESLAAACEACHEEIADQRTTHKGLHGKLDRASECESCHSEHHGSAFVLTSETSFTRAGIADRNAFDHAIATTWTLTGAHARLACETCHENATKQVLAQDEKRFVGLTQACTQCHEDRHEGRFGADCQSCHGQEKPFATAPGFEHPDRFPLTAGHAGHACAKCHETTPELNTIATPQNSAIPLVRACAACHENAHAAGGTAMRIDDTADCSRCHDTAHFRGTTFDVAAHARIGVRLEGAHESLACASCHGGGAAASGSSTLASTLGGTARRDMQSCSTCHIDPHATGNGVMAIAGAGDCKRCHETSSFHGATYDAKAHAAIGVDLLGKHRAAACTKCHDAAHGIADSSSPRDLAKCATCHEIPHGDRFVAASANFGGKSCKPCHESIDDGWRLPVRMTAENHGLTGFDLKGKHVAVACDRCHEGLGHMIVTADFGHRFPGRGQKDCTACHQDPHAGEFARGPKPRTCVECHDENHFRPVDFGIEDHTATAMPLDGAHAAVSCNSCHQRDGKKLAFRGLDTACASCHEDVHRGQFRVTKTGVTTCTKCHSTSGTFDDVRFDHQRDTRFPLDGSHQKVACAACHKPEGFPQFVRYKPLPVDCAGCHTPNGKKYVPGGR
ncbi:MAG: hypothetical protein H6832_10145 [Planctomycetes bacterium]|nr:hypothetical protein [Planctomycetota bacterium]MCB9891694.1 hypothetical protein [Planctomycetota bacterium]MCB9918749.1 hypothetical protein [Planctomycetota bacterium]